jgi:hypothetical protein
LPCSGVRARCCSAKSLPEVQRRVGRPPARACLGVAPGQACRTLWRAAIHGVKKPTASGRQAAPHRWVLESVALKSLSPSHLVPVLRSQVGLGRAWTVRNSLWSGVNNRARRPRSHRLSWLAIPSLTLAQMPACAVDPQAPSARSLTRVGACPERGTRTRVPLPPPRRTPAESPCPRARSAPVPALTACSRRS